MLKYPNLQASIPQALMLMNNEIMTEKTLLSPCFLPAFSLLSPWSPLMLEVKKATSADQQLEAACVALLSRKPFPEEKALWTNLYPAQRCHVGREVYRRTDINAEGTNVRSGSTADGQTAGRDIPGDEISLCDVKDLDGARCAFNGNPFAGEVVESLAIVVDSGDHRGNLLNIPNKAR
jgi:hypothetical protein